MHSNSFAAVCVFLFAYSNSVSALDIRDCGSYFTFDNIQLENCDMEDDLFCNLFIGKTVNISFTINTGEFNIQGSLTNDVNFIIGGTKFVLNVEPLNPCDVLICPLNTNYNATYYAAISVSSNFHPLSGELEWILKTDGDQLLCFRFPVYIKYSE